MGSCTRAFPVLEGEYQRMPGKQEKGLVQAPSTRAFLAWPER